jgi:cyanophycin synthetase
MPSGPFGFRYRSRQSSALINLRLGAWPEAASDDSQAMFERVDAWLEWVLGMTVPDAPAAQPQGLREALALGLAWRALLLGQVVRAGGAEPVFEPGRPLALVRPGPQASAQSIIVRASVTAPIRSTVDALELTYQHCGGMLPILSRTPIGSQSRRAVCRELSSLATQTSRQFGGLGKSTIQTLKAAWSMDLPFTYLGDGVFQLGWGARSIRIERSVTAGDTATGARLSQNKASTCALLARAGLPVPVHRLVRSEEEAVQGAEALGWALVVKPGNRDRGEGVTIGIDSIEKLRAAYKTARKLSPLVLVERQVPGVCHRIFIARGRVLYAVRRDPRSVFGDGVQTVASLIEAANLANLSRPPWERREAWPADELAVATLAAQGLAMASVPAKGRKVALRPIESTRWGGDDEDMSATIHPENARLAEAAARLLGLENAGIDLMTVDIAQPWHRNGAVINEVNFAPTLGAAEISRRHVPEFIRRHLGGDSGGDGRIPIHVVIGAGAAAEDKARSIQQTLTHRRLRCWVTSARATFDPSGAPHALTVDGLFRRVRALLLNSTVDALVMMVDDTALLSSGLPVDCIVEVIRVSPSGWGKPETPLEPAWRRLLQLFKSYQNPNSVVDRSDDPRRLSS